MTPRRLTSRWIAALSLTGAACGGPTPAPPAPPPAATAAARAPAPAERPARWLDVGGVTSLGPELPEGRMVLLAGRRALARPDGSLALAAPTDDQLVELAWVPLAGAKGVLVGRTPARVLRFDDPLGPGTELARGVNGPLGAMPGAVVVLTHAGHVGAPRVLDVSTGATREWRGPLPPSSLAFVDEQRGAGVFPGVGLATTTDAGATWKTGETSAHTARQMFAVELVPAPRGPGRELYARFSHLREHVRRVDLPSGSVLEGAPPELPSTAPPLVRWIAWTGAHPLLAVAEHGIDLGDGTAAVGLHGAVAHVDLATANVRALALYEPEPMANPAPCQGVRAQGHVVLACAAEQSFSRSGTQPQMVVFRARVSATGLELGAPVLTLRESRDVRTSPSGGLLLAGACDDREAKVAACVLQPDGTFRPSSPAGSLELDALAGPTASGELVRVAGEGPQGALLAGRALSFEVARGDGPWSSLGETGLLASEGAPLDGRVEESADGGRWLVWWSGDETRVAHQGADGQLVTQHVRGAKWASFRGGRAAWLRSDRSPPMLSVTHDAGRTLHDVPAAIDPDPDASLLVSHAGLRLGRWARIGWGPGEAPSASRPDEEAPAAAPTLAKATLRCSTKRATERGGRALEAPITLSALPAGTRVFDFPRWGARGSLRLEGPPEGPAKRWIVRFRDELSLGAPERTVSLPAPTPVFVDRAPQTTVLEAHARRERALVAVQAGGRLWLVRVDGARATVLSPDAMDRAGLGSHREPATGRVGLGESATDPVAWQSASGGVVVWPAGGAPKLVALGQATTSYLGAPTRASVPIMVSGSDWLSVASVPLAALLAPTKSPESGPFASVVQVADFRREAFAGLELGALPALPKTCKGRGGGAIVDVHVPTLVVVDERKQELMVRYEVRLDGPRSCLLAVATSRAVDRGLVRVRARVDLLTGRAEASSTDAAPMPATCAFEVPAQPVTQR